MGRERRAGRGRRRGRRSKNKREKKTRRRQTSMRREFKVPLVWPLALFVSSSKAHERRERTLISTMVAGTRGRAPRETASSAPKRREGACLCRWPPSAKKQWDRSAFPPASPSCLPFLSFSLSRLYVLTLPGPGPDHRCVPYRRACDSWGSAEPTSSRALLRRRRRQRRWHRRRRRCSSRPRRHRPAAGSRRGRSCSRTRTGAGRAQSRRDARRRAGTRARRCR